MLPEALPGAGFLRTAIRIKSSFDQVHRVAEVDVALALERGEGAEVGLMALHRGAQNREVARQLLLRERRHHATQRWLNRNDFDRADFQHSAGPLVLDEAAGIVAGVDQEVGAKAAIIEIGTALGQTPHISERAGRDQMKGCGIAISALLEAEVVGHLVRAESRNDRADRIVGEDRFRIDAGALANSAGTVLEMKAVAERLGNYLGCLRIISVNRAAIGQGDLHWRQMIR